MPHPMLLAAALVQSTSTPPPPPMRDDASDVVVTGVADPYVLKGDVLRAGMQMFDRDRAAFSPAGTLFFAVEARRGGQLSSLPRLWLSDGRGMLPVSVAADGRLALPPLPGGKWRLLADASRRRISVRPHVTSPGSSPLDQRLGDARLQCRVFWAMAKESAPLLAAPIVGAIDMVGARGSKRIGFYHQASGPVRAAEIRDGARVVPVELSPKRLSYRLPLADRTLGNEARVRVAIE